MGLGFQIDREEDRRRSIERERKELEGEIRVRRKAGGSGRISVLEKYKAAKDGK